MAPGRSVEALDHAAERHVGVVRDFHRLERTALEQLLERLDAIQEAALVGSDDNNAVPVSAQVVTLGALGRFLGIAADGLVAAHAGDNLKVGLVRAGRQQGPQPAAGGRLFVTLVETDAVRRGQLHALLGHDGEFLGSRIDLRLYRATSREEQAAQHK